MLTFHFDREKTIQAAAYIIGQRSGRRMKHLLLLKMLYLADRESLAQTLQPITGDAVYAMKFGPVLSHVKEMIDSPAAGWDDLIETDGYDVILKQDAPTHLLSQDEMERLGSIARRYDDAQRWDVVALTHEFPEWKNHYRKAESTLIPASEILAAVGRDGDAALVEEDAELGAMMAGFRREG